VESGRLLIERAYFNKDCPTMEKALVALSMCRPKYRLNSNQVESVVHDNYSHCQDAMMYASQGISDIEYYSSERKSIESYVTEYNPFD
jgi:hypothetical protein